MRTVRIAYRVPCLLLVSMIACALIGLGCLMLAFFPKAKQRFRAWWVSAWARTCAAVIGMRVHVQGTPPQAPFILVSNHLGYVDVLTFFSVMPCRFVAKSEVRSWPILGQMAQIGGTLFVNRKRKRDLLRVNHRMQSALRCKSGLVFFPEGTSTSGASILPFKPALLDHAARSGMSVSVATLFYHAHDPEHPAHLDVCWWGVTTFASHFPRLLALPGFDAHITFSPQLIQGDDRKILAELAWRAAVDQFRPTHPQSEPKGPTS